MRKPVNIEVWLECNRCSFTDVDAGDALNYG